MLDKIRKETGGWGAKLLFAFLASVFIFWMGGSAFGPDPWVAKVNGRQIPQKRFEQSYKQKVDSRRAQNQGKALDTNQLAFIRDSTLEELVDQELLVQSAEKMGFVVTPREIRSYIVDGPYGSLFKNPDGTVVDGEKYREVLLRYGLTDKEFEELLRRDLLQRRMTTFIQNSVKVTDPEILEQYQVENDKVELDFVRIVPQALAGLIEITDAEVATYESENAAEIETFYQDHLDDRYIEPKKASIRRITVRKPRTPIGQEPDANELTKVKRTADDALAAAQADFQAAATKYSEGPAWEKDPEPRKFMERQLEGPIATQVFGMSPEDGPALVETSTAFVIVTVDSFAEEKTTELDEVRTEIARELLTDERVETQADDFVEQARTRLEGGASLEEVVAGTPLRVRPSGEFGRDREPAILTGATSGFLASAFESKPGTLITVDGQIPQVRDAFVLAVVKNRKRPDLLEFDSKKDSVRFTVQLRKQNAAYRAWKEDARARARIKFHPTMEQDAAG